MLELNTSYNDLIMVIELNGALDSRTGFDFYEFITEKILEGKLYFALDCTNLEFLSSGGISAIVGIHNVLKKRNGIITLFRVRKEIFQLVEFLNLQETIPIHENSNDALNWIRLHRQALPHQAESHAHLDFFTTENRKPKSQNNSFSEVAEITATTSENSSNAFFEQQSEKKEENEFPVKEKIEEESFTPTPPKKGKAEDGEIELEKSPPVTNSPPKNDVEDKEKSNKEFSEIIICSHCGGKLLVKRNGKHMCPICQNKFYYPPQK